MKTRMFAFVLFAAAAMPLAAQGGEPVGKPPAGAEALDKARARSAYSDAGKAALAEAKATAAKGKGLRGPERARALEVAAAAYDKVASDFAGEPPLAAFAALTAADLWRQQGSLPLAEKGYALAAQLDAPRFGQRAWLGVADMQRRQQRLDDAFASYAKVAAIDPGSSRAQEARLWQARLLQGRERLDEAIVAFQQALESADPGAETIEACNFLALAWIDKGDLDAASRAIEHAEQHVPGADDDPIVQERLKKSLEGMSARKALQRARDRQSQVGKDAAALEAARTGK
jgi:tetratricopeptide (TPR) repeat protein